MSRFRKRPVVIEAWEFTLANMEAHLFDGVPLPEGIEFCGATYHRANRTISSYRVGVTTAHKQRVYLEPGDWITAEPDGRGYYPIKPDIFAATYEPAEIENKAAVTALVSAAEYLVTIDGLRGLSLSDHERADFIERVRNARAEIERAEK